MGSFYNREDLASRLRHLRQRGDAYAFCVGSGLTAPRVPGVGASLKWATAKVERTSQRGNGDRAHGQERHAERDGFSEASPF